MRLITKRPHSIVLAVHSSLTVGLFISKLSGLIIRCHSSGYHGGSLGCEDVQVSLLQAQHSGDGKNMLRNNIL